MEYACHMLHLCLHAVSIRVVILFRAVIYRSIVRNRLRWEKSVCPSSLLLIELVHALLELLYIVKSCTLYVGSDYVAYGQSTVRKRPIPPC